MIKLRPEKSVRLHSDLGPLARQVAFKDAFDHRAVFLPDSLGICPELNVAVKGIRQPERCLDLSRLVEKTLLVVRDQVVENLFELGLVTGGVEGKSRKSLQSLPQQSGVKP